MTNLKEASAGWKNSDHLDIGEIKKILPHRYPFLLVDRILHIDNEKAVGIKNFTINETFFQGHFPDHPVVPGVLIIEAMAQIAGIVALRRAVGGNCQLAYLAGVDKARFRETVVPGDQLRIETQLVKEKRRLHIAEAKAWVGDKKTCEATIMFVLADVG